MNVLFFGPNGSGKGTQGAIVHQKYNMPHIESNSEFAVATCSLAPFMHEKLGGLLG